MRPLVADPKQTCGTSPRQAHHAGGFSLLELVVAIALFALVSVMAHAGLRAVLDARAITDESAARLGQLQMSMSLLGRDLDQLVRRPTRDAFGELQPPLRHSPMVGDARLELVRAGVQAGPQRSSLQRVAWELRDGVLYRLNWSTLDAAEPEPALRMPLLGRDGRTRVNGWAWRFHHLDALGIVTVLDYWPPAGREADPRHLPLAVELILDVEGEGQVTRLFALP